MVGASMFLPGRSLLVLARLATQPCSLQFSASDLQGEGEMKPCTLVSATSSWGFPSWEGPCIPGGFLPSLPGQASSTEGMIRPCHPAQAPWAA